MMYEQPVILRWKVHVNSSSYFLPKTPTRALAKAGVCKNSGILSTASLREGSGASMKSAGS
jgi:hypothetical protein